MGQEAGCDSTCPLSLCLSEGGLRSHLKAQIGTDIRVSSLISHDCQQASATEVGGLSALVTYWLFTRGHSQWAPSQGSSEPYEADVQEQGQVRAREANKTASRKVNNWLLTLD